jgi:predicted transcriptional regulator
MDGLSARELKVYEALLALRGQPIVTYDEIAERAGVKRCNAFRDVRSLEEKGIVQGQTVRGRRYEVKKLELRKQ